VLRRPTRFTTPADVMDATLGAVTIGLVPVMGSLHAGHHALIRRSHAENDDTIVAMVDPSGKPLDLSESDLKEAGDEGARIFYLPSPTTVFPDGFATLVHVEGIADRWEGASRPGHFDRVTTLITILHNQLQPTRTYLGEKHLQQVAVLERVHRDLSLAGEIVPCPTVRDPDGLPLSSYNCRLTDDERAAALAIPNAMFTIQQRALDGETQSTALEEIGRQIIASQPLLTLDYLAVVDPETFDPLTEIATGARAIVAATIGGTRIIDNIHLQRGAGHPGQG
jgi:pantoate--beta-alanine ligase